jgi:hypothetical protein
MRTTRGRQPRAVATAVVMIVAGLGGLIATTGTASADVDSVQGTGFGISVEVAGASVIAPTPDPTLTPPLLVANEASPPAALGPFNTSVVTIGGVLGILNNGVSVGPVSTQAGRLAGDDHGGFVAAASQVANVNILNGAIDIPLITSSCVADGDGARGFANISGATIGGTPLLNGPLAPNTVIDVLGLAVITLNEQIITDVPPAGGNPGSTEIVVNAAHVQIPADGSVADIILAQSFCEAVGPDVLLPPTTTTTAPPATTTTTAPTATTTTTAPTGTTTTTAPTGTTTTTAPTGTTTTTAPAGSTTTTLPPTGTLPSTTAVSVTTPTTPGVLVRTGANLQPLAVLSGLSIVLGILLLIGTGRPLTAGAHGGTVSGSYAPGTPEKWGPVEIGKTIWAGFAALVLTLAKLVGGRRDRRGG